MKNIYQNPVTVAAPVGSYSQAVRVQLGTSTLIFISGQVAFDFQGNFVGKGDIIRQTEQVFENLKAILASNNASFADVVKMNVYATDMSQRAQVAEVRKRYLTSEPPASTFVEVTKLAGPDWLIEIEAIAATHGG